MNLKKIHHVAIIASDYRKSKDFYVNLLGLKIIRKFIERKGIPISLIWK